MFTMIFSLRSKLKHTSIKKVMVDIFSSYVFFWGGYEKNVAFV